MNLHGLVSGVIGAVNLPIQATLKRSIGPVTAADGSQTPAFNQSTGEIQVQAFTARELQHLENLNVGGVLRKVYAFGRLNSIIRAKQGGGDLLTFDEGKGDGSNDWLTVQVLETWPDWCSVAVSMQLPGSVTPGLATIYYGSSSNQALDSIGVQALQNQVSATGFATVYTTPAGGFKYISFPAAWGSIASAKDLLTGLDVPFDASYSVTINTVPYTVYRTFFELGVAIQIQVA